MSDSIELEFQAEKFNLTDLFNKYSSTSYPEHLHSKEEDLPAFLRRKKVHKNAYFKLVYLTEDVMKFAHKGYQGFLDAVVWLIENGWGFDGVTLGQRRSGKSNFTIKFSKDLSKRLGVKFSYKKNLFVGNTIRFDVFWLREKGFGKNEVILVDDAGAGEGFGKSAGLSGMKSATRKFFMIKAGFDMPFMGSAPSEDEVDPHVMAKDMMFRIVVVRRNDKERWVEIDIEYNAFWRNLRGHDWVSFAKGVRVDYIPQDEYDRYKKIKDQKLATEESWENANEEYQREKNILNERVQKRQRKEYLKKIRDKRDEIIIPDELLTAEGNSESEEAIREIIEPVIYECLDVMIFFNENVCKKSKLEINKQNIYNYFRKKFGGKVVSQRWFNIVHDEWELPDDDEDENDE